MFILCPFLSEVPGAQDFLQKLSESQNHKVGIATGGWRSTARLKLESAGFDISQIPLSASDETFGRTEIMKAALSQMGTSFDVVTYYGDAEWDRNACENLGWEFQPVGLHLNGIESFHDANDA